MYGDLVSSLFADAIMEIMIVAAPVLVVSVVVGLLISILQAATSIQEQTLTFVPKLFAVFITMILTGDFLIEHFSGYTIELFGSMVDVGLGL